MRTFRAVVALVIGFVLGLLVTSAGEVIPRTTPVGGNDYTLEAKEYTKGWEQLKLEAYRDNTRFSIGYGTISYFGEKISIGEAEKRFNDYWKQNIPPLKPYVSSKGQFVALADTLYNKGGQVDRFLTNGKIDCEKIGKIGPIDPKYYSGIKNRRVINYKLCTGEIEWHEAIKRS